MTPLRANILSSDKVLWWMSDRIEADGDAKLIMFSSYHSQASLNVQSCQDEDIRH